jgi:hypothetical protein
MQDPIEVGVDGVDAIGAITNIISDEELNDQLSEFSKLQGVDADARPIIASWAEQRGIQLDYTPEAMPAAEPPTTSNVAPAVTEIRRLAGL